LNHKRTIQITKEQYKAHACNHSATLFGQKRSIGERIKHKRRKFDLNFLVWLPSSNKLKSTMANEQSEMEVGDTTVVAATTTSIVSDVENASTSTDLLIDFIHTLLDEKVYIEEEEQPMPLDVLINVFMHDTQKMEDDSEVVEVNLSNNKLATEMQAAWRGYSARSKYEFEVVHIIVAQSSVRRWLAIRYIKKEAFKDVQTQQPDQVMLNDTNEEYDDAEPATSTTDEVDLINLLDQNPTDEDENENSSDQDEILEQSFLIRVFIDDTQKTEDGELMEANLSNKQLATEIQAAWRGYFERCKVRRWLAIRYIKNEDFKDVQMQQPDQVMLNDTNEEYDDAEPATSTTDDVDLIDLFDQQPSDEDANENRSGQVEFLEQSFDMDLIDILDQKPSDQHANENSADQVEFLEKSSDVELSDVAAVQFEKSTLHYLLEFPTETDGFLTTDRYIAIDDVSSSSTPAVEWHISFGDYLSSSSAPAPAFERYASIEEDDSSSLPGVETLHVYAISPTRPERGNKASTTEVSSPTSIMNVLSEGEDSDSIPSIYYLCSCISAGPTDNTLLTEDGLETDGSIVSSTSTTLQADSPVKPIALLLSDLSPIAEDRPLYNWVAIEYGYVRCDVFRYCRIASHSSCCLFY
jgi:hypothetical protein